MHKDIAKYIKNLIEADLSQANDNLSRAEKAFKDQNLEELYGLSGQTKRSILETYIHRIEQAEHAIRVISSLEG